MNIGIGLTAIVSLLLVMATAGGTSTGQAGVNSTAASGRTSGTLDGSPLLIQSSIYAPDGARCGPCGYNHNETLVRDAAR